MQKHTFATSFEECICNAMHCNTFATSSRNTDFSNTPYLALFLTTFSVSKRHEATLDVIINNEFEINKRKY